jgi:hypothetical protein
MATETLVACGTVHRCLGRPAHAADFTFQAAAFDWVEAGPIECFLHEFTGNPPPAVLRLPFEKQYDAVWARARLPRVFGFAPEFVEEEESALLDIGFLAQPKGLEEAIPFVCADHHGRAGLRSLAPGPDPGTRRRIARAFWSLLLANPDDLADFEQMVYHEPNDVWLKLGCLHGKLYCDGPDD